MNTLDKFGKIIVENLRDKAIHQYHLLEEGKLKAPKLQELQSEINSLNSQQKKLIERVVMDALDVAMHDFLFAIQDCHDRDTGISILVDGENIAAESGMLNGEHIGAGGWIDKYSRFKD